MDSSKKTLAWSWESHPSTAREPHPCLEMAGTHVIGGKGLVCGQVEAHGQNLSSIRKDKQLYFRKHTLWLKFSCKCGLSICVDRVHTCNVEQCGPSKMSKLSCPHTGRWLVFHLREHTHRWPPTTMSRRTWGTQGRRLFSVHTCYNFFFLG